eukprot:TRINITY_DN3014_c0_g1_i6.p1 TRINITY_DN3014_c0_g1~~TRINITY_DN3014_c0_g1_i6.p1  ORF type:complete len:659 (+),score=91.44 TRINITY_DN3014_c0_g1_i6:64-1977(+)
MTSSPPPSSSSSSFDVNVMRLFLDGKCHAIKDEIRAFVASDPVWRQDLHGLPLSEQRLLTLQRAQKIIQHPRVQEQMKDTDLETGYSIGEVIGFADLSANIKCGVMSWLFTGAVKGLGSPEQESLWLPRITSGQISGMFAMTELGHGSNVRNLETEAIYDSITQEFVINTPRPSARKAYIGNAIHGQYATVFAKLIVQGKDRGPHAFLVPIRPSSSSSSSSTFPGIHIEDLGHKGGLLGVDNGIITFSNVRVPRENLLNRFASVDPAGNYIPKIESDNTRFNTMLMALTGSRVALSGVSISVSKVALTIAIRHAARRVQFGPTKKPEMPIISYTSHQLRLFPLLATCYALDITRKYVATKWAEVMQSDAIDRSVQSLCSGFKSYCTWFSLRTVQVSRECCGGAGYMSENRLTGLRADADIFTTFEGDNVVLLQQVGKDLLTQYQEGLAAHKFSGALTFLNQYFLGKNSWFSFPFQFAATFRPRRSFLDHKVHLELMRYRQARLLHTLALRLVYKIKIQRKDAFLAWNECLDHIGAVSTGHIETIVLERFQDALQNAPPSLKPALSILYRLYALDRLYQQRAWYLEHKLFSRDAGVALQRLIASTCLQVKERALAYVDAFGVPESCLGALLAQHNAKY